MHYWIVFCSFFAMFMGLMGSIILSSGDRKTKLLPYKHCRACERILSSAEIEVCSGCERQISLELHTLTLPINERFEELASKNIPLVRELDLYTHFGFHEPSARCMCTNCAWQRCQNNPLIKAQLDLIPAAVDEWDYKRKQRQYTHTVAHPWWGPLNEIIEGIYSFRDREELKALWKTSNTRDEFMERFEKYYASTAPRQAEMIRALAKETE